VAELAEPLAAPGAGAANPPQTADAPAAERDVAATAKAFARVRARTLAERALVVLLVAFVAKQLFAVAAFPAFSGHDEVAHFSYVRTLATEGRIPLIPELDEWRTAHQNDLTPPGDFFGDDLYPWCRFALDWYCEPDHPRWGADPPQVVSVRLLNYPSGFQYAANHPPLYYALMSPVYLLSRGFSLEAQQALLRLATIPFGIATVVLAYRLTRTLFPRDSFLAVTVPAFVAFQPQISYEGAMINNDILGIALFSLVLYLCVLGLRDGFSRNLSLALGVTLGLSLLAKGTSLIALPVAGLAVLLGLGWWDIKGLTLRALWIGLPTAVLAAPWYLFLYRTYGNFDAFEQIAAVQWQNRSLGGFFEILFDRDFVLLRFKETWGEYGWRLIHLDDRLLWAIAAVSILSVVGLVAYAVLARRGAPPAWNDATLRPSPWQVKALVVLVAACVVGYLAVVQFGTRFALTQARYYFPVVIAAALLSMLGLRTLIPAAWRPIGRGVVVAALIALNVTLFLQYVLPFHASIVSEMPWLTDGAVSPTNFPTVPPRSGQDNPFEGLGR